MAHPLVSIVIPVYNGGDYLSRAIESALNQTYDNKEIIVVNDGSVDDHATRNIALSYGPAIRYFEKSNGGVASALNFALTEMRGEYFSWLSHDDEYGPEKIQSQVNFLASLKSKDVVLYTDFFLIDKQSRVCGIYEINNAETGESLLPIIYGFINGCTLLIPKTAFDKAGAFNEDDITVQDYDMWFRIAKYCEFLHIPTAHVSYRIHELQASRQKKDVQDKEADQLFTRIITSLTDTEQRRITDNSRDFPIKFSFILDARRCYSAKRILLTQFACAPNDVVFMLKTFFYRYIYTSWRNKYNMASCFYLPRYFFRYLYYKAKAYVR